MTLHLSMEYTCSECESKYIPYNETIVCPKCGHKEKMEKYPDLVNGICDSFVFNIQNTESFNNCWITMDISDSIQSLFFPIFDVWAINKMGKYVPENRTKEFKKYLKEKLDKVDFGDNDYIKDYLEKLAIKVYEEFFNIRKYNLEINGENIKLKDKNE